MKRRKSISSQAESISAWWAVFDWPSIVAALIVDRQVVDSSSAALRNTAARSSHGQLAHSRCAAVAAAIALSTSSGVARCQSASTWPWACGITTVSSRPDRIRSPPMTIGISQRSCDIESSRASRSARSGVFGA